MQQALIIIQLVCGLILTVLVLLQAKGTGLGRTLGSTVYHSRRGLEHLIFRSTIILAVVFVVVAIISQLFIR